MPIYDYLCMKCSQTSEILVTSTESTPQCTACGSSQMKKLLSATSSLSGAQSAGVPGPGDTACCGHSPGHSGCAGPGSCCGKNHAS